TANNRYHGLSKGCVLYSPPALLQASGKILQLLGLVTIISTAANPIAAIAPGTNGGPIGIAITSEIIDLQFLP
ncbi:hypothetical protein, partial [Thermococcus sp. PK]|uniref:hypothetical protein n=1 Tax=Thermococcus sp. PK TaxID=913025 RepID=UPI0018DD476A